MKTTLETDYLIIGAGISGLSFVDGLFTRGKDDIIIIDKRLTPGGPWNDSYPSVRLHQPAESFRVESTELADFRTDEEGPNRGFLSLSTGPHFIAYCHAVVGDRFLPSGRVRFLSTTKYKDGALHSLMSGNSQAIRIRKRIVDATYYTNDILLPARHVRKFSVSPECICIPQNDVPRMAGMAKHFTILGGGKTGMDTCVFLLLNGVDQDQLRWPNDEAFESVFRGFVRINDKFATAKSAIDLAHRHEKSGFWIRLDHTMEPSVYSGATLSIAEMEMLRSIKDVIRLGRARSIHVDHMELELGRIQADKDTIYVDCTATAISFKPALPIFQPGKIILQMIRFLQIPFSCAYLAALEEIFSDDDAKNACATPIQGSDTVDEYVRSTAVDLANRAAIAKHPELRKWLKRLRLDGFQQVAQRVEPTDTEKLQILAEVRESSIRAAMNLPTFLNSIDKRSKL